MSGKNPPVLKSTGRRSGRRSRGGTTTGSGEDAVVAPGFGTKKDIEQLSHDLSVGGETALPSAAVEGGSLFVSICWFVCYQSLTNFNRFYQFVLP